MREISEVVVKLIQDNGFAYHGDPDNIVQGFWVRRDVVGVVGGKLRWNGPVTAANVFIHYDAIWIWVRSVGWTTFFWEDPASFDKIIKLLSSKE